ncbi:caffeoylshikimate esterase [Andrographis paniculata]|uniref:caffeoylshikimate esterase n=1 Tax=Andrographis paniculata TaxID=175694 RepID=UPI0021E7AFEE|nr:caffeoylshikimate esterase [Andrographis paniculata]
MYRTLPLSTTFMPTIAIPNHKCRESIRKLASAIKSYEPTVRANKGGAKMEEANGQTQAQPKIHGRRHYWGDISEEDYYRQQGIKSSNSFYASPRGLNLFTRSWRPLDSEPTRGVVCMVHGYGNDVSWSFQGTPIFLAQNGFACFALDLEGHGKSEGLKAYVPSVDDVVSDCLAFFSFVLTQDPGIENLPRFLYGESMGGAICLLMHFRRPDFFRGAVLIAPMCRISDNVKPKWPIPEILTVVAKFAPTLGIVPTADLLEKSVKVSEKKVIGAMNPLRYGGKPRLGTVQELLRVTDYVSGKLGEVDIPFIVIHGKADVVTDPEVSRELYESAKSADKSIKIYEGMMHSLLFGETDENIAIVRGDILKWLKDRC